MDPRYAVLLCCLSVVVRCSVKFLLKLHWFKEQICDVRSQEYRGVHQLWLWHHFVSCDLFRKKTLERNISKKALNCKYACLEGELESTPHEYDPSQLLLCIDSKQTCLGQLCYDYSRGNSVLHIERKQPYNKHVW